MFKTSLFVCASSCSIDQFTNRLSIFNLIEDIQPSQYPGVVGDCTVVIVLEREDGDAEQIKLDLKLDNNGKEVFSGRINFDFDGKRRCRSVVTALMPFTEPGILRWRLSGASFKTAIYEILAVEPPNNSASFGSQSMPKKAARKKAVAAPKKKAKRKTGKRS